MIKLYDENAYIKEFTAQVLACEKCDKGYEILLDKTAFFPEAGGQPADKGTLDGIEVLDVQIKEETIYHYTKTPLELGKTVKGELNFERRFNFMQNHSGEHIISGIVNSLYSFDNVGFHLSEEFATIDFNGILDREQLDQIEILANKCVFENVDIKAFYPTDQELKNIKYRSKKELDGAIRIVQIGNTDICACCAPHVSKTGEIGIIKLLDFERMRGGIRIIFKCGSFALLDYQNKYKNISEISALLSAKQNETAEAVKQLDQKATKLNQEIQNLKKRMINIIVSSFSQDKKVGFYEDFDVRELQLLADSLHKTYGGLKAVFSKTEQGFNFAICDEADALDEFFKNFKANFNVRGGGRNGMVQGSVQADMDELKNFFEN